MYPIEALVHQARQLESENPAFHPVAEVCKLLRGERLEGVFSMKVFLVVAPQGSGVRPNESIQVTPGPSAETVYVASMQALSTPIDVDGILLGEREVQKKVLSSAQAAAAIRSWLEDR